MLTVTAVFLGIAVTYMWLPPPTATPPAREVAIEKPPPVIEFVEPGHRGVLRDQDGLPITGVVIHLTELRADIHRYYPSRLTNFAGQFRMHDLPAGWYRVQALVGWSDVSAAAGTGNVVDRVVYLDGAEHPDLEFRFVRVPLLHFIVQK